MVNAKSALNINVNATYLSSVDMMSYSMAEKHVCHIPPTIATPTC